MTGMPRRRNVSRPSLQRGYVVTVDRDSTGTVEFVPSGGFGGHEVLVRLQESNVLRWVNSKFLTTVKEVVQSSERRDVKAYRDTLSAIELWKAGHTIEAVAHRLSRAASWVEGRVNLDPAKVSKPKGMDHWDSRGFCDVTYVRQYAKRAGLFERIVQSVDWEQDHVWRVHKGQQRGSGWHLRTVKECQCGAALKRCPDDTRKIGQGEHYRPSSPHSNWSCAKRGGACCEKPDESAALQGYYMWCPRCKWYVCGKCSEQLPNRATSKQVAPWRAGECSVLDELVMEIVTDLQLPDPLQVAYTVKMNFYPDGLSKVSTHRHDNWTALLSLGSPSRG